MVFRVITVVCLFFFGMVNSYANTPKNQVVKAPSQSITVTEKDPVFTIKLRSNPTTGFSWFVAKYDKHLIKKVKHRYVAPTSELMGAPGYEVWTFKVKNPAFAAPKTTHIDMIYARPWEKKKAGKKVRFRVIISQK